MNTDSRRFLEHSRTEWEQDARNAEAPAPVCPVCDGGSSCLACGGCGVETGQPDCPPCDFCEGTGHVSYSPGCRACRGEAEFVEVQL